MESSEKEMKTTCPVGVPLRGVRAVTKRHFCNAILHVRDRVLFLLLLLLCACTNDIRKARGVVRDPREARKSFFESPLAVALSMRLRRPTACVVNSSEK